jgi:uncharacterized protein DUF3995
MNLSTIAGTIAAIILAALAIIHFYWAFGGTFGKSSAIPSQNGKPLFTPTRFTTIPVALGLIAMAALIAAKAGWIAAPANSRFVHAGLWVVAAIFLLRAIGDFRYVGFFKRYRDTRFAKLDTLAYSPLCLLLACLMMISANS